VLRRENRQGYKAGALVEGLAAVEGEDFVYVAIFDADFEAPEDFLYQSIHHMQVSTTVSTTTCGSVLGANTVKSVPEYPQHAISTRV
jgi:cellulose synthase/poly-beta-1,6-N-acetylglucosamine synthase-like glycosyltransferase